MNAVLCIATVLQAPSAASSPVEDALFYADEFLNLSTRSGALLELADRFQAAGRADFAFALGQCAEAAKRNKRLPETFLDMVMLLLVEGRTGTAGRLVDSLLVRYSSSSWSYIAAFGLALAQGDTDAALVALGHALTTGPTVDGIRQASALAAPLGIRDSLFAAAAEGVGSKNLYLASALYREVEGAEGLKSALAGKLLSEAEEQFRGGNEGYAGDLVRWAAALDLKRTKESGLLRRWLAAEGYSVSDPKAWKLLMSGVFDRVAVQLSDITLSSFSYERTSQGGGDYVPILTPDGGALYFCSTRSAGRGGEDIWMAQRLGKGWMEPVNTEELNTEFNEGPGALSPDGSVLYMAYVTLPESVALNEYGLLLPIKSGKGGMDIFESPRTAEGFGEPSNLTTINSAGWEAHVAIAPDNRSLVFASSREGGAGRIDLWLSERTGKSWGEPEPLKGINSPHNEYSPFIHADNHTLYFASDRPGGLGGLDIWVSKRTKSGWREPLNLGYPYNTPGDDMFLNVPASGQWAYISRADSGLGEDTLLHIWRVELPEPGQLSNQRKDILPEPVKVVLGRAFDPLDGKPLGAKVRVTDLNSGKVVATYRAEPATGEFTAVLPGEGLYSVTVSLDTGRSEYSFSFDVKEGKGGTERIEAPLVKLKVGAVFPLNSLFFDFGEAALRPESRVELSNLARLLKGSPLMHVEIAGHTDSVGTAAFNLNLSTERAEAVRSYLVGAGVAAERMSTTGFGEAKPVDTNATEAGRQKNRRVEIKVLSY